MSVREQLHEAIQGTTETDEALPEGCYLLGWYAIAEWSAPDGDRWLSQVGGDARGEAAPNWQAKGYLVDALDTIRRKETDGDGEE